MIFWGRYARVDECNPRPGGLWLAGSAQTAIHHIAALEKTTRFKAPLNDVVRMFFRHCRVKWHICFIGTDGEFEEEMEWAVGRPKSLAKGVIPTAASNGKSHARQCLTSMMKHRLSCKEIKHTGCSIMLHQSLSCEASSTEYILQTIISNAGTLWSTVHQR